MAANDNEVTIGAQGRVVIPASLRKELQLNPGDRLVARSVDGNLFFVRREAIERGLRERFKHIPDHVSLSDELIAERRAESNREAG